MGMADVVPGVSGGTMAVIFGIYPRLINAIKSFDSKWFFALVRFDSDIILKRPDFIFLLPLFIGIISALLFFTRIVPLPVLIKTYPVIIYSLFFGLIIGSILVLIKQTDNINFASICFMISGMIIGLLVFNMVPTETPETAWFIFISGMISISAMILPGISGSFILLMLKKYAYILNAIGYFDFKVIIPFALGVLCGLMLSSRILSWLIKRFYQYTIASIIGLLIASLWVIWPFQNRVYEIVRGKQHLINSVPYIPTQISAEILLSISIGIIGLLSIIFIDGKSRK